MTPPTAALPIAACPNPECRKGCEVIINQGREARVQCVGGKLRIGRCGYRGPSVESWRGFKGYDGSDDSLRAEAIRLHNLLCAPAVQATADADGLAREIWAKVQRLPVTYDATGDIAAIIRKHSAVSPKAAQEDGK